MNAQMNKHKLPNKPKIFKNFLEFFLIIYLSEVDKPIFFLIFPITVASLNIMLNIFDIKYFCTITFLSYEYLAGNSVIVFIRDIIVYEIVIWGGWYICRYIKSQYIEK